VHGAGTLQRRVSLRRARFFALAYALGSLITGTAAASPAPERLRCEYLSNPLGIDVTQPRLSWVLRVGSTGARSEKQTAYRVLVASTLELLQKDTGDLWDSGKVSSGETIHIVYSGKPLASRMACFWKVRVWDGSGQPAPWSAPAMWSMGLLNQFEWRAQWVSNPKAAVEAATSQPADLVRKQFRLSAPVRKAMVYVTARGLYELRINGQRVGDHVLAPEWTSYGKRLQYQAYDVTKQVRSGENVMAALLGAGWYVGRIGLFKGRQIYGKVPQLLLRLDAEMADGRTETVVSDASWRHAPESPFIAADLLDGEVYDARKEPQGWDSPVFSDRDWPAVSADGDLGSSQLVSQRNEPLRVVREIRPVAVTEPVSGVWVFDLGQNLVGWCRLKGKSRPGQPITMRYAEMLNDKGAVYTANLRGAKVTDRYFARTADEEVYEPRFTYHGFRYVEVSGLADHPSKNALVARVIHSAAPETGVFETSSAYVNQLMRNIVWTERANLFSIPTDCPQRDERLGWMGDIQAFGQTAIFNMDVAAFLTKWLQDVRDDQLPDGRFPDFAPNPNTVLKHDQFFGAPAWGDAGTVVPWRMYQNYADRQLLAEHFEAARRWVDFIERNNSNLLWEKARGNDYNDWLNADTLIFEGWPKTGGAVPQPVFATAFFAHSTDIVAKMAAVLGRTEDAEHYRQLFDHIKSSFNRAYVKENGEIQGDTQAGYALALNFNLLPDESRSKVFTRMLQAFARYNGHLSTGIQSTHRLLLELTRGGRSDEAYRLLNLRTFPSWGFMITNGATTIWERWDGYVRGRGFQNPEMNSFNHWALGSVGEWMWRTIAGINPDEESPGFRHFYIRPQPGGGLMWARGEYESIRGRIVSDWRIDGGVIRLRVVVPPNTSATVSVPTKDTGAVRESGRIAGKASGVKTLEPEAGAARFRVDSGEYVFTAPFI